MRPLPETVDLATLQRYVEEMERERGFASHSIDNQFMKLMEECGELSKAVRNLRKHPDDAALKREVGHEAADVLLYLICLANRTGVSLTDALREKEAINETRRWDDIPSPK